jgi:hypothetical protein
VTLQRLDGKPVALDRLAHDETRKARDRQQQRQSHPSGEQACRERRAIAELACQKALQRPEQDREHGSQKQRADEMPQRPGHEQNDRHEQPEHEAARRSPGWALVIEIAGLRHESELGGA